MAVDYRGSNRLYPSKWDVLHSSEKKYIHSLCDLLAASGRIGEDTYKRYQKLLPTAGDQAFAMACYETMSFFDVIRILGEKMYCEHKTKGTRIQVKAVISQSTSSPEGVIILEGSIPSYSGSLAIKWYQGHQFDVTHECALYSQIAQIDRSTLPWFSPNYQLWREPVLIVRTKKVLDGTDHERDVGVSILNKLKVIHQVCLHCDIKADNIVKSEENGRPNYYLIDFGQSTPIDEKEGGYHTRYVHTKKYMRQGFKDRSSVKTDLIELLHALRRVQIDRVGGKGNEYTKGFEGCLKTYKKLVDRLDEYPSSNVYDKLIAALEEK